LVKIGKKKKRSGFYGFPLLFLFMAFLQRAQKRLSSASGMVKIPR